MIIIASTDLNSKRIKDSFQRILENCATELSVVIEEMPLIITDEVCATEIYNDEYDIFKKAFIYGFGGIKGNINFKDDKFHLVVLNIAFMDLFNLFESEFDGVLAHELGHIFNQSPIREIPSILKGYNIKEIENAKKIRFVEMETYADYFSKLTGTSKGLLSSMEIYIASENCKNRELFIERIATLNSDAILLGTIKGIL